MKSPLSSFLKSAPLFLLAGCLFVQPSTSFACLDCSIPIDKLMDVSDIETYINQSYRDSTELSTRWERPLFSVKSLEIYSGSLEFQESPLNNQIVYLELESSSEEKLASTTNGDGDSLETEIPEENSDSDDLAENIKDSSTDEASQEVAQVDADS